MCRTNQVLIVDDCKELVELYTFFFDSEPDLKVKFARSREEVIQNLASEPVPSLLLMNYFMPGMALSVFLDLLDKASAFGKRARVVLFDTGYPGTLPSDVAARVDGFRDHPLSCEGMVNLVRAELARLPACPPSCASGT